MPALNASKRMPFGWSVARAQRGCLAPTRIPSLLGGSFFESGSVDTIHNSIRQKVGGCNVIGNIFLASDILRGNRGNQHSHDVIFRV